MTDPTQLSLAAQTVLNALNETSWDWASMEQASPQTIAAATLRAAADQVVPSDLDEPRNYLPMAMECQRIREELLAIAAELETQ